MILGCVKLATKDNQYNMEVKCLFNRKNGLESVIPYLGCLVKSKDSIHKAQHPHVPKVQITALFVKFF